MKKLSLLLILLFGISVFESETKAQCTSYFQSLYNTGTGNVDFTALCSYDTTISPVLFQWDFGDGYGGYGETCSHNYSTPGGYLVCLVLYVGNGPGCCQDTFCELIDYAPTVIEKNPEWISELSISSSGKNVNVFLTLSQKENLEMSLVTLEGRIIPVRVSSAMMKGRNDLELDLPDYPPGIYLLRIRDNHGNIISKRFMIF